jgi:predicted enzyme related to lactoylglutathione lyase
MSIGARFVHTSIVAGNWKRLARFYQQVFRCRPVGPERDLSGEWLQRGTNVPGATIRGVHLQLPGYGEGGPTLEIFQYEPHRERGEAAINRPGLAHIAFAVDDVQAARSAVISAGGGVVGDVVTTEIPGAGVITFVYVSDPEGNIVELQKWLR